MGDDISTRRATHDDLPAVIDVARAALGWTDADAALPALEAPRQPVRRVADVGGGGRRPRSSGSVRSSGGGSAAPTARWCARVRAVDTATVPEFQGRGIFTRLTLDALDELRDDGVDLVFNTPNANSLPGYLKMGWQEVGRLPVVVRPNRWRFPFTVLTAGAAAGRDALPASVGTPADGGLRRPRTRSSRCSRRCRCGSGFATDRTPELYAWRYGNPNLGYRVVHTGSLADGCAVFRLRRRGRAVEAVVSDVLAPRADVQRTHASSSPRSRRERGADYLIRLGCDGVAAAGFVPVPRMGPLLTCRPLDGVARPGARRLAAVAWATSSCCSDGHGCQASPAGRHRHRSPRRAGVRDRSARGARAPGSRRAHGRARARARSVASTLPVLGPSRRSVATLRALRREIGSAAVVVGHGSTTLPLGAIDHVRHRHAVRLPPDQRLACSGRPTVCAGSGCAPRCAAAPRSSRCGRARRRRSTSTSACRVSGSA